MFGVTVGFRLINLAGNRELPMLQRLRTILQLLPVLGIQGTWSLIVQKLLGRSTVCLRVRGVSVPLFARLNNSDLSVLFQVFRLKECDVKPETPPGLIIDGGANVGYTTAYFAQRFPQAQILAVEPHPGNCDLLARNTRHFPNVTRIQGAIWFRHANLDFVDQSQRAWMTQVHEVVDGRAESIPVFTMPELIDRAGRQRVDILKLDIEGAEQDLFSKGDLRWLDQIGCLIIEVHGEAARRCVTEAMTHRGYACEASGEKLVFQRSGARSG